MHNEATFIITIKPCEARPGALNPYYNRIMEKSASTATERTNKCCSF